MEYNKKKGIYITAIIIILFILASLLSNHYADTIRDLMLIKGVLGIIAYIIITVLAILVAPVSTLPLLPIAVTLWGPNQAAIFSITGWTIGALFAFFVARIFGRNLVSRFMDIRKIEKWSGLVPRENLFWILVFARAIFPVDVISYAFGLFTSMHWLSYLAATIIGIIPFAFIFSYGSELPALAQVIAGIIILFFITISIKKMKKKLTNKAETGK